MLTTTISNQTISISSFSPNITSATILPPTEIRIPMATDQASVSTMAESSQMVPTVSNYFKNDVGSSTLASSQAKVSTSTGSASIGKSNSIKDFLSNTLPKPQPFSMEYLGKRMFTGAVFGVVGSAVTSAINISTGNWSGGQAAQFMIRDAIKGAVGGGGFGLGMGLTTMALSRLGVAGLPLTVASIVGGSTVSIGAVMGMSKALDQWSW